MSDSPLPQDSDDLQFEVVESGQANPRPAAAPICAICKTPIGSSYYSLRDNLLCPRCREDVVRRNSGNSVGRYLTALAFGLGAGLVGTVLWCVIRALTHWEIGIVAMLMGYMVGKAVRRGSGGWGGRGYQVLSVLITYVCITGTYLPDVWQAIQQKADARHAKLAAPPRAVNKDSAGGNKNPQAADAENQRDADAPPRPAPVEHSALSIVRALAIIFGLCLTIPVLVGVHDPIMLIIFGIGLWEAWKFTGRLVLPIKGPFQLGPRPA